jgi:hypothetical protein
MAKKKVIKLEEFNEVMKPGQELSFGDTSPFSAITTPPRVIMTAWHANYAPVLLCNAHGTAYVMRDDCGHFNFDVYSINVEDSVVIVATDIGRLQPYHRIGKRFNEMPEFLKNQIPEKIKTRIMDFENQES